MKLSELLNCVPLNVAQFKNYKHRGQLPFVEREEFSIAPGEKLHSRWTDYTLDDALRLQVMVDLSKYNWPDGSATLEEQKSYDGLPPLSAANIAQNGVAETLAKYGGLNGMRAQDFDIWHVALVIVSEHKGDLWYGMERFSGTIGECAEKIEELKEGQVRAIVFNVSQAFERVLTAGETHAVAEVVDFIDAENA